MTIKEALQKANKQLKKFGIENFSFEGELLLSFILDKPREFLFTHPEKKLNLLENIKFQYLLIKRCKWIPLAYIIGSKEFYGLNFLVNKNTLIPRPETELIVDESLAIIYDNIEKENLNIIDLGTGSGCIIITLTKLIKEKFAKFNSTNHNFIGVDINDKTLEIAKKNSSRYNLDNDIKFIQSDLLTKINKEAYFSNLTIITANLPYLTPDQVKNSPTIQKEPKRALIAVDDGLFYYKKLFQQIKNINIKVPLYILCEIDDSQKKSISNLIKEELPQSKFIIKKDLQSLERLVIITI